METISEYESNICFVILICIYVYIYINCSLSLPVKDSSAEYSNENFSCALYCIRDHIFLYKLLPCNLHRWCWKKWINDSSKYFLRFPVIVLKLSFVISVLGLSFVIAFSFELLFELIKNHLLIENLHLALKKKVVSETSVLFTHVKIYMLIFAYFCARTYTHTHTFKNVYLF